MKTLKKILILILLLLFQLPILGQQKNTTQNHVPKSVDISKNNDDDDDDDDDDEDEDEDEIIKHPTLYFVTLDPSINQSAVNDLLSELNSEEIWYRKEINLRLWNTTQFPYVSAHGQTVTNIDGQVQSAEGKTDIDGVEFNIGHIVPNPPVDIQNFCFNTIVPQYSLGTNPIKISIFDTGISTQSDANFPGYSFNIDKYTGYDYIDNDSIPNDQNGHGSHIAGIIQHLLHHQGTTNSPISFDIRKTHDHLGRGYVSNLIPAILDAVNEGNNILNFSFSYQNYNVNPTDKPLKLAIDYAEQNGAMIIAAAGNTNENNDTDNIISFPASYPNDNILSVASTDCDNKLSQFSSYGQQRVDVALLGENIPGPGLNAAITNQSGTSFSSANVTALAAILATHQSPFNYQQIKCSLINTSTTSSDLFEKVVANGVINFQAAFEQLNNACQLPINKSSGSTISKPKSMFFPNPFKEILQLHLKEDSKQQITVSMYNQNGILTLKNQFHISPGENQIDLPQTDQLQPGMYFIKVNTESNTTMHTIIKQ
ncbi:S8/S53 family peptidase [Aquimarina algiphila]|uniref:S8/S53 family peptidase n=1 Tax=Aquimarina algiphila TaxID=2047982 RepID=UPI00232AB149|nr:S8/S53 family peptidase [Aquimarina algiphila]